MHKKNVESSPSDTTEWTLSILDGYLHSAILQAAIDHGLFWLLEQEGLEPEAIAETLELPLSRCHYWLQGLAALGFLERCEGRYDLTEPARRGIVSAYSQNAWSMLALEAREASRFFTDFSAHFKQRGSMIDAAGIQKINYIQAMMESPARAEQFTKMLYEIHQELAEVVSHSIQIDHVDRFLDLGGGSGVIASALIRKFPQLEAVVMDIPTVCQTGEEIQRKKGQIGRLRFLPGNFMEEELPSGFDLVLACDVGIFDPDLFAKIHRALKSTGRFVIVDHFAQDATSAPHSRWTWAIQRTLDDPDYIYPQAASIIEMLETSGFFPVHQRELTIPGTMMSRFVGDMYILEAFKGRDVV